MPNKQLEKIATSLMPGGRLLCHWQLTGGVSAQTTAIEIGLPDNRITRLVIRQHGEADLRRNPQIAVTEYRLLEFLHGLGLPVPQPYRAIPADAGLGSPALAYVEGKTELAPSNALPLVAQMAEHLLQVHAVDITKLSFLSLSEQIACNQPTLLHGDYWPGNILWQGDQLAAIIDWEDACLGDPLSDLANSRLELQLPMDRWPCTYLRNVIGLLVSVSTIALYPTGISGQLAA